MKNNNNNTIIKKTVNFNKNINKSKNDDNSYIENNTNTETSVKTMLKTKVDYSVGKKVNPIKNQYNNYIRNLDPNTKVDKFKKGFFNTSVTYEKNNDIRNRTFDGKYESNSKSKERTVNINTAKLNNLNSYKQKMNTNANPVNLYLTGRENKNINILNTEELPDDNSNKKVINNTNGTNKISNIRNSKYQ